MNNYLLKIWLDNTDIADYVVIDDKKEVNTYIENFTNKMVYFAESGDLKIKSDEHDIISYIKSRLNYILVTKVDGNTDLLTAFAINDSNDTVLNTLE